MRDRFPVHPAHVAAAGFGICLVVVLTLTLMPVAIPNHFPSEDKVHHILAFFTLAVLACVAWNPPWWTLVPALSGLGAMIELLQHFIPNRSMELNDWIADTVGVVIGWLVYPVLFRVYQRMAARRNS